MANESPLLIDGNLLSGADYRNSTLSGTTHSGKYGSAQFQAVRLSSCTDRTILLCTAAGQSVYGILQNKPNSGDAAAVAFMGVTKALAGNTVTPGATLQVDSSGCLVPYSSATGINKVGYALEGATVGQVFTMALYGFGGNVGGNT